MSVITIDDFCPLNSQISTKTVINDVHKCIIYISTFDGKLYSYDLGTNEYTLLNTLEYESLFCIAVCNGILYGIGFKDNEYYLIEFTESGEIEDETIIDNNQKIDIIYDMTCKDDNFYITAGRLNERIGLCCHKKKVTCNPQNTNEPYHVFGREPEESDPDVLEDRQTEECEITITCPTGATGIPNDPGKCGAIFVYDFPTAVDCEGNPVCVTQTEGILSGDLFPVGTTTNVFVAEDDHGNTATCSFDVTVIDVEPPTNTKKPYTIRTFTAPGSCGKIVYYPMPEFQDNCPCTEECDVLIEQIGGLPSGSEFPSGVTINTFIATDCEGNTATTSFKVIVEDNPDSKHEISLYKFTKSGKIKLEKVCLLGRNIYGNALSFGINPKDKCDSELYHLFTDKHKMWLNRINQEKWCVSDVDRVCVSTDECSRCVVARGMSFCKNLNSMVTIVNDREFCPVSCGEDEHGKFYVSYLDIKCDQLHYIYCGLTGSDGIATLNKSDKHGTKCTTVTQQKHKCDWGLVSGCIEVCIKSLYCVDVFGCGEGGTVTLIIKTDCDKEIKRKRFHLHHRNGRHSIYFQSSSSNIKIEILGEGCSFDIQNVYLVCLGIVDTCQRETCDKLAECNKKNDDKKKCKCKPDCKCRKKYCKCTKKCDCPRGSCGCNGGCNCEQKSCDCNWDCSCDKKKKNENKCECKSDCECRKKGKCKCGEKCNCKKKSGCGC
jgi:hypothetical protein